MPSTRAVVLCVLAAVAVGGCDAGPGPTTPAESSGSSATGSPATVSSATGSSATPVDRSAQPDPANGLAQQLGGPWRRSPIILDDSHIAIISDACATAARKELGEIEANLPTAVINARGEQFATAILADDLNAIECLARLDETGAVATVDAVDRLSITAVAPVDGTNISVASLVHLDDGAGGRTIAFGRIGPDAESAKVGFDDASVILATDAAGWWAMWWQGTVQARSYAAVDPHGIVVGNTKPFQGEREARVGPASWWLNPRAPAPSAASTTIQALVHEQGCASGTSPEGRIEPPVIEGADATVTITFEVRKLPGTQDCQGNPPFAVTIKLPESLANRALLDGGETPPRDAGIVPGG